MKLVKVAPFLLSLSITAFAGIGIETQVIDKIPGDKNDQYICLGAGWEKVNLIVRNNIRDLKVIYPELFKDLSETQKNCFAPLEVPVSARKLLDETLTRIEAGENDRFHLTVQEDGSLIPTNPHKKLLVTGLNNKIDSRQNVAPGLQLRHENDSFRKKLARAELLVGGVEAVGMGTLILLPKSVTKWEDDWMKAAQRNLKRAWSNPPVMDRDDWFINYIGHPVAGAIYYNAMRSQGVGILGSFLFSAVQSTIWEYGIEAVAEQPSIQDLILTPVVGSIMGELSHLATLRMARNGYTFGEKVLITVINPTYAVFNGFKNKVPKHLD